MDTEIKDVAVQFERLVRRFSRPIDQALKRFAWPKADAPSRLLQAMSYSMFAGGKRLRPMLVLAASEAVGGRAAPALPVAAAFEMIHTYSLIHDDLPAMDNDDLRRGRPTCHKAFDEATAILAGDGMLTFAFEVILRNVRDPRVATQVVLELAKGAGIEGMVGGQQADLEGEGQALSLEKLVYIHSRKTGALITAAVVCGGLVGKADKSELKNLRQFGREIGLAFQVVDDILDVTSTAEQLGKSPGKDQAANKQTYPALMGLEKARAHAQELIDKACSRVARFAKPEALTTIAQYFVARTH
ncbi:MAG: polyprenyl synthetase family protein [Planctomycetes bacterium]|nr:polyprenyl synthetase family protein [Planctomycetota bacterium]